MLQYVKDHEATLLVATIPDPSDREGYIPEVGMVSEAELAALEAANEAIRTLARQAGVFIADLHYRFLGHGHCHNLPRLPRFNPLDTLVQRKEVP